MTHDDFFVFFDAFVKNQREILKKKGADYTIKELNDKFDNFRRIALLCGIRPQTVIQVYAIKHIDACWRWCREGHLDAENIYSHCKDACNFLSILAAFAKEEEDASNQEKKAVPLAG